MEQRINYLQKGDKYSINMENIQIWHKTNWNYNNDIIF